MKLALKSFAFLLIVALFVLPSCKGSGNDDVPETEKERVTGLLVTSQWKIKTLTIDGVAKNSYPGLKITFTPTGFTSTGGEPVWPASGTWAFTDDGAKMFKRDDQTVVTITSIDNSNLELSLGWTKTTLGPGRIESVEGTHVFVMEK